MAEKSPPRPITPAAPAVRPAAARVPPRAPPMPVAAPAAVAPPPSDERIVRLEKRVAELERQQETSQWDRATTGPPPAVAPAPIETHARSAEPAQDARREDIRALVKMAVDEATSEATSMLRAEWERIAREAAATREVAPVREGRRAHPVPTFAPVSVAPAPVFVASRVEAARYEIPSANEPLAFDIPPGLDGSARRRKVAFAAAIFLLVVIGGLISAMLASRNR